jgi:DNA invertase Pin-like site-specific DNA recombinase
MIEDIKKLKLVRYRRKSSEAEDRQIASLDDQKSELLLMEAKIGFVPAQFETDIDEARSAKAPGRKGFDELIEKIRKGTVNAISVWHPNRLSRNATDIGTLIQLMDDGKLIAVVTPGQTFQNLPMDKFMLQFLCLQAKLENDNKSVDVRRGLRSKVMKGYPTGPAKLGYMNDKAGDKGQRVIFKDDERFLLVKKLWELFLSGKYSVRQVWKIAVKDLGLTTIPKKRQGGKSVSLSHLYRLFADPFYAGFFYYEGERHSVNSSVPRMISESDFQKVQQMLGKKGLPQPQKHPSVYNPYMKCGYCKGATTPDFKFQLICSDCKYKFSYRNRENCPKCGIKITDMENPQYLHYIYYQCNKRKNPNCPGGSIEQKEVDDFLKDYAINKLGISQELSEWCLKYLVELDDKEVEERTMVFKVRENEYAQARRDADNLLKMRLREEISEEEYKSLKPQYDSKVTASKRTLDETDDRAMQWRQNTERTFSLAHEIIDIFENGSLEQKKDALGELGSNLMLAERKLTVFNATPFEILLNGLMNAREINPAFEPKSIEDLSDGNDIFVSVRPTLLRDQDSNLEPSP